LSGFDDILGGTVSVLDRPLKLTTFPDELARTKVEQLVSMREFAERVHRPTARTKAKLPLLKLARFGDVPTTRGTLRNNANVLAIDGIEGDYDGEVISIAEAAALLKAADIAAVLYSSPSHTSAKPRWRVLCPLGATAAPDDRERLCARLNSALGGLLSGESFTLSQSYYFGLVQGAAAPAVAMVDGRALDAAKELDETAIGRNGEPYRPCAETLLPSATSANDDEDDWDWQPLPDWDRIDSALASVPVKDADQQETGGRDMWLRVGQALHHVSGGSDEGFARWDAWSRAGDKYNARHIRRDWNSFRLSARKQVRIATLFDLAKRYGWTGTSPALTLTHEPDSIDAIGSGVAATPARAPTTALRFLTPAECASSPARGYVVKGFLAPKDLACIFGAPGAGKSLIAPHIAYQTSLGRTVFGMRTKASRVFYVAPEDAHGMRGRVTGLSLRHGDAPDFVLVENVSDLLAIDSPDLVALRAAIADQRPALVFLDTLAMSFPGLEENTAEAMGRVVAIARSLTVYGAAVILIHHDTKAQGPTPRGHSLLNGALDVALQLFPRDGDGIVRASLTKNRNGTCDRDIAFRIAAETLGEDEDGDAITAALVDELAPGAVPPREKLTPSERAALRIFDALSAVGPVDEAAWRKACIDSLTVSAAESRESRRKASDRAVANLARKGAVQIADGIVRRPGSIGDAYDDD
jgi:hypothetical protein